MIFTYCSANLWQSRLLAQHPEVQQRLRAECLALPSYITKDLPTKEELKKMKYLANVIHEGLLPMDMYSHFCPNPKLNLGSTPLVSLRTDQYASGHKNNRPPRWRRPRCILSDTSPQRRSSLLQRLRHAPPQGPLRGRRRPIPPRPLGTEFR